MKLVLPTLLFLLAGTGVFAQPGMLDVQATHVPGFYDEGFELKLFCADPEARIFYTLDGRIPNANSTEFAGSIPIKKTTVVRAVAYRSNQQGKCSTSTFFLGPIPTFPVVSLSVEPNLLFDNDVGMFKMGPEADTLFPFYGANFWTRDEIEVHMEFFETTGQQIFNSETGLRIFGGMSRLFPQKSVSLVARQRYGEKQIRHQIFPYTGQKKFKFIILRNSGSDWGKSHLRDAYMTYILRDLDVETQAFRPSHTFINGKYWGIYNLREKVNRYFLAEHSEWDKDSVEIIEHRFNVMRGSGRHYQEMLEFLESHDLSVRENYEHLQTLMEVNSFLDLQIAQIYLDNQDAGGNIKYWRPHQSGGKWRWILYDMDYGMGLHSSYAYRNNTLAMHTAANGPNWPNPPWSTFLLRKLLENEEFQRDFVNRYCDYASTIFRPENMLPVLDTMAALYEPEIDLHLKRWDLSKSWRENHLKRMRNFIRKRPPYIREYFRDRFNVGSDVELAVRRAGGGRLILNGHYEINASEFNGLYFKEVPVKLKATAFYGYRFSHWEFPDGRKDTHPEIEIEFENEKVELLAQFVPSIDPLAGQIIFNEISCADKVSGDWVELHNLSRSPIDLSGWVFLDTRHDWSIPNLRIEAGSFAILCKDTADFRKKFPDCRAPLAGNFPFGLNKIKERLELYTLEGAPIDSFSYFNDEQDTVFTLNLLLPTLNNAKQSNWELLSGSGSPGDPNPSYVFSQVRKVKNQRQIVAGVIALLIIAMLIHLGFRHIYRRRSRPPLKV